MAYLFARTIPYRDLFATGVTETIWGAGYFCVLVHHLFRFADEMSQHQQVLGGLRRAVVASIGPVTSETLREYGISPDLEPSHPKMGFLVKETAKRSADLLRSKALKYRRSP